MRKAAENKKVNQDWEPLSVAIGESDEVKQRRRLVKRVSESLATSVRRNRSATIHRTDEFKNIEEGLVPFRTHKKSSGATSVTIDEAVELAQKAYYNFSVIRQTIELMVEFSCSDIFFIGGTSKSRQFFENWLKEINIWNLQDQFFREYFRSGNIFIFPIRGTVDNDYVSKINKVYGTSFGSLKLPVGYTILDPASISANGMISFSNPTFYLTLNEYEVERLRKPRTEQDRLVYESLDEDAKQELGRNDVSTIQIELDKHNIVAVFYKKQDYEPFSVPMVYPVLKDINWKQEMKNMDMALTRTLQQVILLITMGTEPDKGGVNYKHLQKMMQLFDNESIGRVLVSDYTTEAKFVIPDIADILAPQKYDVVNTDIREGLSNILLGENNKYADSNIKIKVFIERLRHAREAFLANFLIPQIKAISKEAKFKTFPTPVFDKMSLQTDLQLSRIYARLMELGILTPEEGFEALEKNRLPQNETFIENQKKFKTQKEAGLFAPIMNNQNQNENGRPPGAKSPQTTKNVSPIGTNGGYSLSKIQDGLAKKDSLKSFVEKKLREKFKIKRLSNMQKSIASELTDLIIVNEPVSDWETDKINVYFDNPVDRNHERISKVREIADYHRVDMNMASILLDSITNVE